MLVIWHHIHLTNKDRENWTFQVQEYATTTQMIMFTRYHFWALPMLSVRIEGTHDSLQNLQKLIFSTQNSKVICFVCLKVIVYRNFAVRPLEQLCLLCQTNWWERSLTGLLNQISFSYWGKVACLQTYDPQSVRPCTADMHCEADTWARPKTVQQIKFEKNCDLKSVFYKTSEMQGLALNSGKRRMRHFPHQKVLDRQILL